jgi:hypothetical protein
MRRNSRDSLGGKGPVYILFRARGGFSSALHSRAGMRWQVTLKRGIRASRVNEGIKGHGG